MAPEGLGKVVVAKKASQQPAQAERKSERTPSSVPRPDSRPVSTPRPPSSSATREFRRLIDAFHDGVLVATEQGTVYANNALLELLDYANLDELMAHSPKELCLRHMPQASRPSTLQVITSVLRGESSHEEVEQEAFTSSGSELDVHYYFDHIEFDGRGAVMVTARDMTESRGIKDKLNRAERMASIGTLAAGVAHEINNPLAYVTTNVAYCMERVRYMQELLEGKSIRLGNPASLRAMLTPMAQALTEAHQGTSRVATIVRDLRALTREDKELDSPVDLSSALQTAIHMSESESRFRCRIDKSIDGVGAVWGNETRLVQIFLNLIINAAQAFEREERSTNVITIVARKVGDDCLVEVGDNGPGILEEHIGRVFDPFFTTKPVGVGTGLGLSICHGLVESMGGAISVSSEIGHGTVFRVRLRSSVDEAPPSARRVPTINPAFRGRVLVVDDEPLILRSVARLLRDQHDVETAANGREALEKIQDRGPFDLVVCDLMMPEMTGMELHRAVRESDPDAADRFVFLTGGAYTESAKKFLASVENPKLDKPIQPNLLRSVVTGVLRGAAL